MLKRSTLVLGFTVLGCLPLNAETYAFSGAIVRIQVNDDHTGNGIGDAVVDLVNRKDTSIRFQETTNETGLAIFHDVLTSVNSGQSKIPESFILEQNYPNPFNGSTQIDYALPKPEPVSLRVYNLNGQLVKTIADGSAETGKHSAAWNGTDERGNKVPGGLYFVVMQAGQRRIGIKKMLFGFGGGGGSPSSLPLSKTSGTTTDEIYDITITAPKYPNFSATETIKGDTTFTYRLTRENQPPVLVVSYEPLNPAAGDTVSFTGHDTHDTDGSVASYLWTTDGKIYSTSDVKIVFDTPGNHTVGFQATDDDGATSDTSFTVMLNPKMINFSAYVLDNRNFLVLKNGIVEINGVTYRSDSNGLIQLQVEHTDSINVTAYARDINADTVNAFSTTFRVPMKENWATPAGLPITTFDSLCVNVPPELAVSPELFRAFMQEGNFIGGFPYNVPEGLKSIDFQHAQNPVPNPNGPHGYVYWIDRDYAASRFPSGYGTFSQEEQLHIKDVIERDIMTQIRDLKHRPQIYIALPGEKLPLLEGGAGMQPIEGILFITHNKGGNGYGFAWYDYNNDGTIDAVISTIGDPTNSDAKTRQEIYSVVILNGIFNTLMQDKSINSEVSPLGYPSPADLKMLGIEENVSTDMQWNLEQLPSGQSVVRGYYKPLAHIDDIIGLK